VTTQKRTILLVDDEPINIHVLRSILPPDYKIKVALNGQKALQLSATEPFPDLIFMDVIMPDLDGYEVCRLLKSDLKTAQIKIIFVSAHCDESERRKGLSFGAIDFISKPVNPQQVLQALADALP